MPEQITPLSILFLLLYGAGAALSAVLCLYLLLCKGKAIAPSITSPARLRRWAAAFFGLMALVHVWWMLFVMYSGNTRSVVYGLLVALDSMTLPTVFAGTLMAMLQDRRRPLWPVVLAMTPCAMLALLQPALPAIDLETPSIVYVLILIAAFIAYMVVAVRQYGRWLRENYADLKHKEVWLSHTLLIGLMLLLVVYGFTDNYVMSTFVHLIAFPLAGLLLWRVETLPQLEEAPEHEDDILPKPEILPEPNFLPELTQSADEKPAPPTSERNMRGESAKSETFSRIGQLLTKHCEETQLYLQPDMTLQQLALVIGINRTYLSQYFAYHGTSYYTYIHELRINHFISRYRELAAAHKPIVAQQLAQESGYHSYSTFSAAFKQRMGQSVTAWMREA